MSKPSDIVGVIRKIAAGKAVNWTEVASTPAEASVVSVLNELQIIARIAAVHCTTADPGPDDVTPEDRLQTWGPLTVVERVGAGRYGVVYRAWDSRLDREVALKLLRPGHAPPDADRPSVEEGRLLARVRHPNVVTVYGADRIQDRVGIWMEFVEGRTLDAIVRDEGPFSAVQAARIGIEIARGLSAVHRAGLLHRDVKAQNVMRQDDGRIVLMDFGTVHAAGDELARALAGTPLYVAPDVLAGASASPATDVYSLGIVLYYLVTGSYPIVAADLTGVRTAHDARQMTPLRVARGDLPRRFIEIVDRAIAADPAARVQTADDLQRALAAFVDAEDPANARTRRNRLAAAAAAVFAALTVGGAIVAFASAFFAPRDQPIVFGQQTRVTSDAGLEIDPAISPDGKLVAYSAGPAGHMRIFVRQITGGRTIQLTDRAAGDERRPQWSPDGTHILFTAGDTLFSMPAQGRGAPTVVARSTFIRSAAWSRDGASIVFIAGDTLFQVAGVGGVPVAIRSLDASAYSFSISPDGSRVAYASGNPDFDIGTTQFANIAPSVIRVAGLHGGPPTDITDTRHLNTSPIWSVDGRSLFFVSNVQGRRDIYSVKLDGNGVRGEPYRVTTGLDAHTISLSSNGRVMAYSVLTERANIWSLAIRDSQVANLAEAVQLTFGNQTVEQTTVSPDGRLLYFDSDVFGNADVFRMPVDGGQPQRLTSDPSDEFMNGVSPNGREIAFHSFRNGRREIFVMPADGGAATFAAVGLGAQWSPDGSKLLFILQEDNVFRGHRVIERNADGHWSPARQVDDTRCQSTAIAGWSPDGRGFFTECEGKVQILRLDGTVLRTVYDPASAPGNPVPVSAVVSPNGRVVYFKSYDAEGFPSIWLVPVDGGAPRLIARFDDPMRPSNRVQFATDGRRLYFPIDDRQSDVWVVDVGKTTR
jgi:serine/threonine-protein kinase